MQIAVGEVGTARKAHVLPAIVLAQFLCTSLWFAGNAVAPDLVQSFRLPENALAHLSSAVQFGFIGGTLVYALLTIADRFPPSKVFLYSAIAGALVNLGVVLGQHSFFSLLILRFATGFFLAGIYPVGMKIASDYYDKGLGKALGYLVGALVLGTAFPHLVRSMSETLPWRFVFLFTSVLTLAGGLIIRFGVGEGPHRSRATQPDFTAFSKVFRSKDFRSAAFGYFGHMWELYTFWAFVPVLLATYIERNPENNFPLSLLSFIIIAAGGLACAASGYFAQKSGSRNTAFTALLLSGLCCLFSPFALLVPAVFFIAFMIFWGMAVVADSPQFSTLVARHAPAEYKGTALTTVTCIGFSITIISIQFTGLVLDYLRAEWVFIFLGAGSLFGLLWWRKEK